LTDLCLKVPFLVGTVDGEYEADSNLIWSTQSSSLGWRKQTLCAGRKSNIFWI